MVHASFQHPPSDFVDGEWTAASGSAHLSSHNPARPDQVFWSAATSATHVDRAIAAARAALPRWSGLPIERREAVLRKFATLATQHTDRVAAIIRDEVGKVMWEARQEAALLAAKVENTLDASPHGGRNRVTPFALPLTKTRDGRAIFRPHGVLAVLGPFNFPAHLPNGHIVPALLMGNTVVFKPSDKAPGVGQVLVELLDEALRTELGVDSARGIVNLVQGGADVATALVSHELIDGIAFTGSWHVGRRILQANLDRPGRIIALELGGNNPAIVLPDADLHQAAIEIVRCAFNTTGQRCTSTRRAIIHKDVSPRFVAAICKAASNLIIGDPRAPHPVFMGPLIRAAAVESVLAFQRAATSDGAEVLVEAAPIEVAGCRGGHFITPGVLRVPRFRVPRADGAKVLGGCDTEVFGPLLQISTAESLDDAIEQANATRFGLAASMFSRDVTAKDEFLLRCRAGCLNINTGTAGASGKLPFGGLGHSGNHRPAGSFALDYCAHPVAAMIERGDAATIAEGMRFDQAWL